MILNRIGTPWMPIPIWIRIRQVKKTHVLGIDNLMGTDPNRHAMDADPDLDPLAYAKPYLMFFGTEYHQNNALMHTGPGCV